MKCPAHQIEIGRYGPCLLCLARQLVGMPPAEPLPAPVSHRILVDTDEGPVDLREVDFALDAALSAPDDGPEAA